MLLRPTIPRPTHGLPRLRCPRLALAWAWELQMASYSASVVGRLSFWQPLRPTIRLQTHGAAKPPCQRRGNTWLWVLPEGLFMLLGAPPAPPPGIKDRLKLMTR